MAVALPMAAARPHSRRFPHAAWRSLISRVRRFEPDVAVLIARKMPRLAECFGFGLGPQVVIVSDLAIPFVHDLLAGARVAVVDDVVNVGSTINRAVRSIRACGAVEVRAFALGTRRPSACHEIGVECEWPEPLDAAQYAEWTESVPSAIRGLAKPYDLEFPVIPCRLNPPLRTAADVRGWLTSQFGRDRVRLFPGPGDLPGRISVDMPDGGRGLVKFRLYPDGRGGCNVVPFAIPAVLDSRSLGRPAHPVARALLAAARSRLRGVPSDATAWSEEPGVRAELFARSLDIGLSHLDQLGDLISVAVVPPIDVAEVALLFGPIGTADLAQPVGGGEVADEPVASESATGCTPTPFSDFLLRTEVGARFLDRVRTASRGSGGFTYFSALFNELAIAVGTGDPTACEFDWPYPPEEVRADPYKRLRIGPTFEDLVRLYQPPAGGGYAGPPARHQVSALLDYAIDEGFVVPTLARYDGALYRIYRKGETDPRDRAADRALYAWACRNRPMSLTRFAKLTAILSFSGEVPDAFVPDTLTRGNVATLAAGALDLESAEVSHYLLKTGRLEEKKAAPERAT